MWKNHREETVPQACLPTVSSYSSLFPALKVLWTFGTAFQPAVDTAWYCSLVAANGSMGDERTQGCSLVASEFSSSSQMLATHTASIPLQHGFPTTLGLLKPVKRSQTCKKLTWKRLDGSFLPSSDAVDCFHPNVGLSGSCVPGGHQPGEWD
jgi:hypothetical protein